MKKILIVLAIAISIVLVAFSIINIEDEPKLIYSDYVDELSEIYGDDKDKILNKINSEIENANNSNEFIGINLLARQYFFYVWTDNKGLIENAEEAEKHLKKYNMYEELLDFYAIMAGRYVGIDKYRLGYVYIENGERIAKKLYEANKGEDMLSTLVAIKYLKAIVALDIGMERQAEIVFKEARELEKSLSTERKDSYINIILYHQKKKEYDLIEENAIKAMELINKRNEKIENPILKRDYIRIKIILAESYIYTGRINESIELINELAEDEFFKSNIYLDELYILYAQMYSYYGRGEEAISYLKQAYDLIKNNQSKSDKIKTIQLIIEQYERLGDTKELLYWYKIENSILRESDSIIDTQFLLSKIIDVDLENANFNIEILELQRLKMVYLILTLFLLVIIVGVFIIIQKKSKRILKDNINILEKSIKIKQEYYENIKENNENIRRIKHDIKNHILVINNLILDNEYEGLRKYVSKIEKEVESSSLDIATNNKTVDAIISSKIDICKKENIDLTLDIKIPKQIKIDDFDLCVVYGNLLDNALEACKRIEADKANKYIKLKSVVKGDYLFINIKNSYDGNIKIKEGRFITSKKNKLDHGIGIESVKNSIKKYNGELKIKNNNNEFEVAILMEL